MTGRILLALAAAALVVGCGGMSDSKLNPKNWFGGSQSAVTVTDNPNADPRQLVAQIVSLRVEKVPGGAIVRATGLPQFQGYYDGVLLPVYGDTAEEGVLSYQFRASAPAYQTRVGTQQSREIVVGRFVSDQALLGVRQIRVSAATNALVVRR